MDTLFWNIATSALALEIDGVILLAALVLGWFPLLKYLPGIGSYVPAARLVAVLVALMMAFLVGFRISDKRQEMEILKAALAAKQADLNNAAKSAADAQERATRIEADANDQHQKDADYISTLAALPGCGFDPGTGELRSRASGTAGSSPPAPAGAR